MTPAVSAIAYCGSAPAPAELLARWNPDPVLLAVLSVAIIGTLRTAHLSPVGRRRVLAAIAIMAVLFVSPLCALTSALFSARVVHHLVLVAIVAPFLASALPRQIRPVCAAGAALAIHAGCFWLWHVPDFYAAALSSTVGYWTMQATLLATATLFWHAALRGGTTGGLLALVGAVAQMGLLGAILTFAGRPLYAAHLLTTGAWGLSPIEDQQLAGLLMWVPAIIPYAVAAAFIVRKTLLSTDDDAAGVHAG